MKKHYNILAVSIAAALGSPVAHAVLDLTASNPTTCTFAKELDIAPAGTTLTGCNGVAGLNFKFRAPNTRDQNDVFVVNIMLTNGAKFSSQGVSKVTCETTTSGTVELAAAVMGNDSPTAQYYLPSGGTVKQGTICTVEAPSVTVNQATNFSLNLNTNYKTLLDETRTGTQNFSYISFTKALSGATTLKDAAGTVDVQQSSMKLIGAVSPTMLLAGRVTYKAITKTPEPRLADGIAKFDTGSLTNDWRVIISGAPIGAAKTVTLRKEATPLCSGPVYGTGAPSGNEATINIPGRFAAFPGEGQVCVEFSGSKVIDGGLISAALNRAAEGANNLDTTLTPSNLYELDKNGATTFVDFLTPAAGVFPTFVRFTNPTSDNGNVYVTAINDNGQKGANTFIFPLPPGSSVMYPMQMIQDSTGMPIDTITPSGAVPSNKVRLEIEADFAKIGVQALNLSNAAGQSFGQLTGARGSGGSTP